MINSHTLQDHLQVVSFRLADNEYAIDITKSAITEENSGSTEEMTAAAEELSAQAQHLHQLVSRFTVDEAAIVTVNAPHQRTALAPAKSAATSISRAATGTQAGVLYHA